MKKQSLMRNLILVLLPLLAVSLAVQAQEQPNPDGLIAVGPGQRYTETIPVIDIHDLGSQPAALPTDDSVSHSHLNRGGGSDPNNPYAIIRKTGPAFMQPGGTARYEITLNNYESITRTVQLVDTLPSGLAYVPDSANGLVYDASTRTLSWQSELAPGNLDYIIEEHSPALPYLDLAAFGAVNLCDDFIANGAACDDVSVTFNLGVNGYTTNLYGELLSQLTVSSNGLILAPETAVSDPYAHNQWLPDAATPGFVLAGLWRNVDMDGGDALPNGRFHAAIISGLIAGHDVFYAQWHDAPHAENPDLTARHAIALLLNGDGSQAGHVFFIYDNISDPAQLVAQGYTIGVADKLGARGVTYAYAPCCGDGQPPQGYPPAAGTTLHLRPVLFGAENDYSRTFSYEAVVNAPVPETITSTAVVTSSSPDPALATAWSPITSTYAGKPICRWLLAETSEGTIMSNRVWLRRTLLGSLFLVATLGCGVIGFIENPAALTGPAYWAAETGTAVPTVTVFLGTSTPVYADTPVPNLITTTPEWTTVTPVFLSTPTPYWVTTTPVYVTETPSGGTPPTTTPGLPMIGYTTPEPLETPYYRIGTFYLNSDVYVGGPNGLVFRITGHETQPSPNNEEATYHFITIHVTNYTSEERIVPVSDVFFIRRVQRDEVLLAGRWVPQNEPLIARSLPAYETQQLTPIQPDGQREFVLGFVVPNGDVRELGLITDWNRPVEGGLPIWFYLEDDPLGPFTDAFQPPPPTPIVLDDGGTQSGGGEPGSGDGLWPTTGIITRGFGCHELYTGIDGTGFGCPPERQWFHNGVDIANAQGTLIWSPVDGAMVFAGPNSTGPDCSDIPGSQPPHEGLGNYQRVSGGGTLHYFGHLSNFLVTSGPVSAGQNVAEMGSTGCSTGSHLHWIVYQNGNLIDPAQWAGTNP